MDADVARYIREIKRRKLVVPKDGQQVGPCHYSKTGWAAWDERRSCTCQPVKKPKDEDAAYAAFDAWANPSN